MIITCPSCDTGFSVADHLIGPTGRTVRCAKCSHQWRHVPVSEEIPETVPPPRSAIAETMSEAIATGQSPLAAFMPKVGEKPEEELPAPLIAGTPSFAPMNKRRRFPWAAIILLPLLGIGGATTYLYWAKIEPMMSDSLHYVQNLPNKFLGHGGDSFVPDDHLEIGNVKFVRQNQEGQSSITIEASIFNPANHIQQIPTLVAIALDKEGKQLLPAHSFSVTAASIQAGETLVFRTILLNPPAEADSLRIGFAK